LAVLTWLSRPAIAEEVDDQLKRDKLLDIGASPAMVLAYKQMLATVSLKKHALERNQQLLKQQLATPEDVEKAEEDLADAEANVKMVEKQRRGE
jgi:multidrug resistance efflux pump